MNEKTSRIVVVTGATRGLGRALVQAFSALGHTVAGCGRSQATIDELTREFGTSHDFAAVDVVSDAEVKAWAEGVLVRLGSPDLLINNAGLINNPAPLWGVPAEEFDAVIDVNVRGVANVIRHFAPAMVARGQGVIVNVSSGWGRSAAANVAPYNASKFAVEGMTQALAKELPKGMAAVAFNPGVIDTDMLRQAWAEDAKGYAKPDAWAERAAPFLLGLDARQNGQSVSLG